MEKYLRSWDATKKPSKLRCDLMEESAAACTPVCISKLSEGPSLGSRKHCFQLLVPIIASLPCGIVWSKQRKL